MKKSIKIGSLILAVLCPLLIWAQNNPNCTMYELVLDCVPSTKSPRTSECFSCPCYYDCGFGATDQWCVDSYDETRTHDHVETSGPSIFGWSCTYYCFMETHCWSTVNPGCGYGIAGATTSGPCTFETCGGSCD